ncbi:glycoside hydrolase family 68 protein [Sphingomonas oryzagri]|uniref:Glycoside hydrolase family 68 protein n=1 Tax=Sphingomonas oryzagri TaxID=3042314 RepID=A0ABT6N279_9SPHN|nr:glycoside hydrolase family 68 protein [Sphingomonas oryzagri]MDH7639337.1 glycoside hydrolase family 68 protein [Sphingomonas oryzagri]
MNAVNFRTDFNMDAVSRWRPEQVAAIPMQADASLPVIVERDVVPLLTGHVVWDMWPIAHEDGSTLIADGRSFWFFLTAPRLPDPDLRHDMARIRLFSRGSDGWLDHGNTFPNGFTPGSREWSGSAVLGSDGATLTMYFTAAGRAGRERTFEQRLFETRGLLRIEDGHPHLGGWTEPVESVVADGACYARADQREPDFGLIRGFRDPGYFRDPADASEHLLFTGSAGWTDEPYGGVIGLATRIDGCWKLQRPLLSAVGVNAELERPHVVFHANRYYLFWSTQRSRFAPGGPSGPNGLYAMVADQLEGPWRPVNGTGLVAGNPASKPQQAYCWWVTGELDVISFIDRWGMEGCDALSGPALASGQFGGTVAPSFRILISGDQIHAASETEPDENGG